MVKSIRTAGYGPVCPVVWEGGGREAAPYPDWEEKPCGTKNHISIHYRRIKLDNLWMRILKGLWDCGDKLRVDFNVEME